MSKPKRLLIIGSGFSKAVFSDMPTVMELTERLRQDEDLAKEPYVRFLDDPELLLSYLSLGQPWRDSEEALQDKALFIRVQNMLAEHITHCEARAFKNPVPNWAGQLVHHLHEAPMPVITLNYDTVIERILHQVGVAYESREWPHEFDLYDLPLSPLHLRQGGTLFGPETNTFQLIKLHGSINWFYSGAEGWPGEQVYYRTVRTDSPLQDGRGPSSLSDQQFTRLGKDKIPLIIPPVAEKSRFYGNRTIRTLWADARNALREAGEILCVGYSLPETDLTMKLFLQSVARPERVVIVNREDPTSETGRELVERYREAFPEAGVDGQTFSGSDAVQRMAEYISGGHCN